MVTQLSDSTSQRQFLPTGGGGVAAYSQGPQPGGGGGGEKAGASPSSIVTISDEARSLSSSGGPIIVRFRPRIGATGVNPFSNLVMSFNRAIQRGSGNIVLRDGLNNVVETFDAATSNLISIRDDKLTINPSEVLEYDTEYKLQVAGGTVQDLDGNNFAGLSNYFFRVKADDDAPEIRRVRLSGGTGSARLNASPKFYFNEDIQRGSGNIELRDGDGNLVESFDAATSSRISIRNDTLSINPSRDLEYDTEYTITFAAGTVQDLRGNDLAAESHTFRSKIDDDAPEVRRFRVSGGTNSARLNASPKFYFNEDIQRGSGNIELRDGDGNLVESFDAATSSRVSIRNDTLSINPSRDLEYDTEYTITFATGTVQDLRGNDLAAESHTFRSKIDDDAPEVRRFQVSGGTSSASVSSNLKFIFNEDIQRGSGNIELRDGDGNLVESFDAAASSRISIRNDTLTVNPTRNLDYDEDYTLEFAQGTIRDLNGNSYAAEAHAFRTEVASDGPAPAPGPAPGGDTTAPTVTSFSPADGSGTAAINSNIVLTFSENIQRGSGNIVIRDGEGKVIETFDAASSDRLSISNKTLTIDPTESLVHDTQYYVTFAKGSIKDLAGNSYAGTTTYDFTTQKSPYNISVSYSGSSIYQNYFNTAADIWQRVIIGDLPAVGGIDDLKITAAVIDIDGVGGVLGSAGPTHLRGDSWLPYQGQMQFDSADMAWMETNGILLDVVLHEMGHVLGIGSLWSQFGFNTTPYQYTGEKALTAYRELSGNYGATYVPLENDGGPGTANVHWEEDIFDHELMTGYAENSGSMPLSKLTVAALEDLGYTVNYAAAASYTLPSSLQESLINIRV